MLTEEQRPKTCLPGSRLEASLWTSLQTTNKQVNQTPKPQISYAGGCLTPSPAKPCFTRFCGGSNSSRVNVKELQSTLEFPRLQKNRQPKQLRIDSLPGTGVEWDGGGGSDEHLKTEKAKKLSGETPHYSNYLAGKPDPKLHCIYGLTLTLAPSSAEWINKICVRCPAQTVYLKREGNLAVVLCYNNCIEKPEKYWNSKKEKKTH